jgi:hypothetical protein
MEHKTNRARGIDVVDDHTTAWHYYYAHEYIESLLLHLRV